MDAPLRVGILTVSDRAARGERPDLSGPALEKQCLTYGWQIIWTNTLPDDLPSLTEFLKEKADAGEIDLLLTTGGTGFAPRDITPEATLTVVTRLAPGLSEVMRAESLKITPHAMLSRGISGIRGRTLIINLPGSPKAGVEQLGFIAPVLPHAVQLLSEAPTSEAGHTIRNSPEFNS